ncbi:MAG: hypothetical protein KF752_12860 [Pirellulaceae bacterium]|nr:hypothetical protein [Pirellulaceae bacterium]
MKTGLAYMCWRPFVATALLACVCQFGAAHDFPSLESGAAVSPLSFRLADAITLQNLAEVGLGPRQFASKPTILDLRPSVTELASLPALLPKPMALPPTAVVPIEALESLQPPSWTIGPNYLNQQQRIEDCVQFEPGLIDGRAVLPLTDLPLTAERAVALAKPAVTGIWDWRVDQSYRGLNRLDGFSIQDLATNFVTVIPDRELAIAEPVPSSPTPVELAQAREFLHKAVAFWIAVFDKPVERQTASRIGMVAGQLSPNVSGLGQHAWQRGLRLAAELSSPATSSEIESIGSHRRTQGGSRSSNPLFVILPLDGREFLLPAQQVRQWSHVPSITADSSSPSFASTSSALDSAPSTTSEQTGVSSDSWDAGSGATVHSPSAPDDLLAIEQSAAERQQQLRLALSQQLEKTARELQRLSEQLRELDAVPAQVATRLATDPVQ